MKKFRWNYAMFWNISAKLLKICWKWIFQLKIAEIKLKLKFCWKVFPKRGIIAAHFSIRDVCTKYLVTMFLAIFSDWYSRIMINLVIGFYSAINFCQLPTHNHTLKASISCRVFSLDIDIIIMIYETYETYETSIIR